jgi:hypothetical protein
MSHYVDGSGKKQTTQDIPIHVFREIWFFTNVSPFEMPMWREIVNCRDWYPPWRRDTVYVYSWAMQWQPLEQEICQQMETKRLPVWDVLVSYFRAVLTREMLKYFWQLFMIGYCLRPFIIPVKNYRLRLGIYWQTTAHLLDEFVCKLDCCAFSWPFLSASGANFIR